MGASVALNRRCRRVRLVALLGFPSLEHPRPPSLCPSIRPANHPVASLGTANRRRYAACGGDAAAGRVIGPCRLLQYFRAAVAGSRLRGPCGLRSVPRTSGRSASRPSGRRGPEVSGPPRSGAARASSWGTTAAGRSCRRAARRRVIVRFCRAVHRASVVSPKGACSVSLGRRARASDRPCAASSVCLPAAAVVQCGFAVRGTSRLTRQV